jgi:predicted enzyme related to lactoylglutathione lyase
MEFGYLEVVTPDVDTVCATYSAAYGVQFSAPVPGLGNARIASLSNGGKFGVRGPMRPDETPVVRPYVLVDDVAAAIEAARDTGAEIAFGATEIPGQGVFGIFIQGGIESGLWQRS